MKTLSQAYPTIKEINDHHKCAEEMFKVLEPIVENTLKDNEFYSVEDTYCDDDWIFAILMNLFAVNYRANPERTVSYVRIGGKDKEPVKTAFRIINTVIREERKPKKLDELSDIDDAIHFLEKSKPMFKPLI